MKLSYKLLLFAFVLVLTTSSCQTKQHAINQLESLSNDLRDNSGRRQHTSFRKFERISANMTIRQLSGNR